MGDDKVAQKFLYTAGNQKWRKREEIRRVYHDKNRLGSVHTPPARVRARDQHVIYRITMKNNSVYETGYISHDSMVFGQKRKEEFCDDFETVGWRLCAP